jgi:transposase
MRIPLLRREPAAYIKLRRLGYAINTIARAFGRSSSVISRYVIKAILRGTLTKQDLRKIPNQTRRLAKARQWRQIMLWLPYWEKWICGEGDKPP